jgi:superfamily II DNA or RNA helicase
MVDVADIVRLVGPASFGRGQDYARSGAVASLAWDSRAGRLSGTVRGSQPLPYTCFVNVAEDDRGRSHPRGSLCGCPMERDCKHVAALLISGNAEHVRQRTLGMRNAATASAKAEEASGWKSMIGELIEPPPSTGALRRAEPTPMALQFALREAAPRQAAGWSRTRNTRPHAKPVAGAPLTPGPSVRLGVRPAVLSATGNWVAGNVTWSNIVYQLNRLNLEPEQHRWFCQFPALHRSGPHIYGGNESNWLDLDDFASPLLWHLLDDATRIGIQLVGRKKSGGIRLGRSAEVTLDAARADDGGLRLRTTVAIDGRAHAPESVGVLGGHGVYSLENGGDPEHSALVLTPTAAPLTAEQQRLLAGPSEAVVPDREVPEFLAEYYPVLRQSIRVTSTDGSVELPQIAPPVLVLTAKYRAKHVLRLEWQWEYSRGEAVLRAPLDSGVGESGYRDVVAEREILGRASGLMRLAGLLDADGTLPATTELQGIAAAEFSEHALPGIRSLEGVRVVIDGKQPDYRELTAVPKLTVATVETDERDWFDLGVVVTVGDKSVPFGPLFTALAKGRKKLLLIDGSYLSLKQPVFDSLRELIEEARALDEWETGLRISRYQTSLWSDFEDLADEALPATEWREVAAGLAGAEGVGATPLPSQLNATLRPYQVDGYNWLTFLWRHGLGGVLADDMGLGKTLQTLALLAQAKEQTAPADRRPFLVVAPSSVVPNWISETKRFTPGLTVAGIESTQKKSGTALAESVVGADIVVTSYALLRLDFAAYQGQEWAGLILDEAQFVKNRTSAVHQCARDLAAPFKLAITGTPMENNLMELWSLFAIVAPGLFASPRKFAEDYQRPIERGAGVRPGHGIRAQGPDADDPRSLSLSKGPTPDAEEPSPDPGPDLLAKLRRRIRPLMMRRTKEDVAKELPAKQEQVLQIELTPKHRALYDTFLQRERQKLLGLMEDMDKNRFIVFRSLTLLRLLSLDASLVDEQYAAIGSSKLDALFEQLEDVIAEGHRALIFSQFTSFLGKVGARLREQGIDHAYLDGSTRRRGEVIDGFKNGDAPVFLISLKAGGFGLNLTEADYVFLLDPWWNPAAEEQAVDRTHRIGQTRNVMVYRMVAAGTIEEKVMALKERKAKLFNSVLDDDGAFSSALTADDIRGLLDA